MYRSTIDDDGGGGRAFDQRDCCGQAKNRGAGGCPRLYYGDGGWSKLKNGGYNGGDAMHDDQGVGF